MVKYLKMSLVAMLVATMGGTALAQKYDDGEDSTSPYGVSVDSSIDRGSVDMWEALFYGKVVDTWVDDDGVAWEDIWDAEQQVLWAKPADVSRDTIIRIYEETGTLDGANLSAKNGGGEAILGGPCSFEYLLPRSLRIAPDGPGNDNYCTSFSLIYSSSTLKIWRHEDWWTVSDMDGYVEGYATTTTHNYCSSYKGYYLDKDSSYVWRNNYIDDESCAWNSNWSKYSYRAYENSDISGESAWDYPETNHQNVVKFEVNSCGTTRTMTMRYIGAPLP
jgi:hypothetical protein